ncbi:MULTISPECIES: KGGVGR-motif variant AAA ATPase [unclassified Endozoicomonas]|uniref:KGGVGR-motif variant AAA ATPase n=1 Tax=unclassified Endozoicomonas TaxID=2644528 RepID=UPI003BB217F2
MNLYSWLDAERLLASKTQNFTHFPEGIADIRAYSEAIEIDLEGDDQTLAFDFVKTVFGNNWHHDERKIELAYGSQSSIDVEIITDCEEQNPRHPRPLWQDLGYDGATSILPKSPEPFEGKCRLAAFHSFKGGVGRTTSLLTWFKALQVNFHHRESNRGKLKVLLVDADIKAPGLTYLFKDSDKPDVSWIQFLEASHYPAVDESTTIATFAKELDRYTKSEAGFEYCLLPAFSDSEADIEKHSESKSGMAQLINISVRPEHLARTYEQPWRCTDMLQKLGNQLQADLVLIDLRAGLSELSSPLLFDPRVERFVVTTLAEQAIKGTEFILNRLTSLANNRDWRNKFGEKTLDPRVITTFVNEEFKKTDQYKAGLERLTAAYTPDIYTDDANATNGLEIIEAEFSSQLLNLGALDSTLSVIEHASPLLNEGLNWAKGFFDAD